MEFRRPVFDVAFARALEERGVIQVIAGPRQVGKTTLVRQVLDASGLPSHYASADEPALRDRRWIAEEWGIARRLARKGDRAGALLVLDEVQKVTRWSETVKRLWDEDTHEGLPLKVFLLGSAPLLVQRGLTESLAGRFELIRLSHWTFAEMRDAFRWSLDEYLFFGGYPGSARYVHDEARWREYVAESLVETTLSRDVLLLTRVDKPALLRQLFRLGCDYSGQVLAYQKMLGQLQDAGNTVTLAHYLELLSGAGMLTGLQKYSGSRVRQRGSSPKLLARNNALVTALAAVSLADARDDPMLWGRLVETAVGAHLLNGGVELYYWRERNREVDFVAKVGRTVTAFEVTSGRRKDSLPGMGAFLDQYPSARPLLVGGQGIPLEEFLSKPAESWAR